MVRAPMAPQLVRSYETLLVSHKAENGRMVFLGRRTEMYWGEMVSRSSDPTGIPICVRSHKSCRARRKPLLILKESSMSGSLIRPFPNHSLIQWAAISREKEEQLLNSHPTVVRGFFGRKNVVTNVSMVIGSRCQPTSLIKR